MGDEADGALRLVRAVTQRAVRSVDVAMDFNPPMDDGGAFEIVETDKRRYLFVRSGDDGLAAVPRTFDAVVLALSAERSVTARTRELVFELSLTHRGPLVVVISGCESASGEPHLVEIEARELLDQFGFDADAVACARMHGLDASEWLAWLDDHASVCAAPLELPLIARVERQSYRGAMQLGLAQGRIERRAKYQALRGAIALPCAFEESTLVSRSAASFGVGSLVARPRQTGLEPSDWVVDASIARSIQRLRAALIVTEPLLDGLSAEPLSIEWGSNRVDIALEVQRVFAGDRLALVTVRSDEPFFAIERAGATVVSRFELERIGRVVFASD
ncbi:MAG: hypothetical protein U0269_10000 [Polyangiales bacterium]